MKYWRLSYNECLWGLSYSNLIMLNLSIPKFDDKGNKIESATELKGSDFKSRFKKKDN